MTTNTAVSRKERKDLRELAKTLNEQLKLLTFSVGEVRHALLAEARELRKEYRAARRPQPRRSIDPITVFHADGKCSTAKGHDCTELPCQPDSIARDARVTSVDGDETGG